MSYVGGKQNTMGNERLGHLSNVGEELGKLYKMSSTYCLTNVVAGISHVLQQAEYCERYIFVCWVEFISARGFV